MGGEGDERGVNEAVGEGCESIRGHGGDRLLPFVGGGEEKERKGEGSGEVGEEVGGAVGGG